MIELTAEQVRALVNPSTTPPCITNPQTQETFVLLSLAEYQRLTQDEYDDSPWTPEEREILAWEAGKHAGWEDMDEYDHYPEKP